MMGEETSKNRTIVLSKSIRISGGNTDHVFDINMNPVPRLLSTYSIFSYILRGGGVWKFNSEFNIILG